MKKFFITLLTSITACFILTGCRVTINGDTIDMVSDYKDIPELITMKGRPEDSTCLMEDLDDSLQHVYDANTQHTLFNEDACFTVSKTTYVDGEIDQYSSVYTTAADQFFDFGTSLRYMDLHGGYEVNTEESTSNYIINTVGFSRNWENVIPTGTIDGFLDLIVTQDWRITKFFAYNGIAYLMQQPDDHSNRIAVHCFDADTYKWLYSLLYVIDGDNIELTGEIDFEYDAPAPDNYEVLKALYNREGRKMVTFTIVLDPDTEYECTHSVTIPAGNDLGAILPYGYQLFVDRQCMELAPPSSWDELNDITRYAVSVTDDY